MACFSTVLYMCRGRSIRLWQLGVCLSPCNPRRLANETAQERRTKASRPHPQTSAEFCQARYLAAALGRGALALGENKSSGDPTKRSKVSCAKSGLGPSGATLPFRCTVLYFAVQTHARPPSCSTTAQTWRRCLGKRGTFRGRGVEGQGPEGGKEKTIGSN